MRTRHIIPSLAVAFGFALTGCGDDPQPSSATGVPLLPTTGSASAPSDSSTSETSTEAPGDEALAFAQCMRENGVESYPDPVVADNGGVQIGGGDPDDPDNPAAQETCEPLLNGGGGPGGSGGPTDAELAELQEQALAFAACIREQGIDFPDPTFEDGGVLMSGGDPDDPAFQAASDECGGLPSAGGEVPGSAAIQP